MHPPSLLYDLSQYLFSFFKLSPRKMLLKILQERLSFDIHHDGI